MKRNTVKNQRQFIIDTQILIQSYGATLLSDEFHYELETPLGKLFLTIADDNTYNYTVFMRFDSLDLNEFYKHFSKHEVINVRSFKWSLYSSDAEEVILELEERLSNLSYIK